MAYHPFILSLFAVYLWVAPLKGAQKNPEKNLSPAAQALVQRAYQGLDPTQPIVDTHVHLLGLGTQGSGIEIHPHLHKGWHPIRRISGWVYLRISGIRDSQKAEEQYLERLLKLARGFGRPVNLYLLAMDRHYREDGTPDPDRTEFFIPNDYVFRVSKQHPEIFKPVVSIHPYRKDALQELERCHSQGARMVKWLPNAQGIDPESPRCDTFYQRMLELDMVLLSHAGIEKAVQAKGAQELGNPWKLRRPLDHGLKVIVAHCASLGKFKDPGRPDQKVNSHELFLRLMKEDRYKGRLFGDISAVTQINRKPRLLRNLLQERELHDRLIQGSDYPLPAVPGLISTTPLASNHLLTWREARALEEIRRANPLLYDFVLKRSLRDRKTGMQFPKDIFTRNPLGVKDDDTKP